MMRHRPTDRGREENAALCDAPELTVIFHQRKPKKMPPGPKRTTGEKPNKSANWHLFGNPTVVPLQLKNSYSAATRRLGTGISMGGPSKRLPRSLCWTHGGLGFWWVSGAGGGGFVFFCILIKQTKLRFLLLKPW